MTEREAMAIISESVPDLGIRGLHRRYDFDDEVFFWSATAFDPFLEPGEDAVAEIVMMEHYPVPDVTWL